MIHSPARSLRRSIRRGSVPARTLPGAAGSPAPGEAPGTDGPGRAGYACEGVAARAGGSGGVRQRPARSAPPELALQASTRADAGLWGEPGMLWFGYPYARAAPASHHSCDENRAPPPARGRPRIPGAGGHRDRRARVAADPARARHRRGRRRGGPRRVRRRARARAARRGVALAPRRHARGRHLRRRALRGRLARLRARRHPRRAPDRARRPGHGRRGAPRQRLRPALGRGGRPPHVATRGVARHRRRARDRRGADTGARLAFNLPGAGSGGPARAAGRADRAATSSTARASPASARRPGAGAPGTTSRRAASCARAGRSGACSPSGSSRAR